MDLTVICLPEQQGQTCHCIKQLSATLVRRHGVCSARAGYHVVPLWRSEEGINASEPMMSRSVDHATQRPRELPSAPRSRDSYYIRPPPLVSLLFQSRYISCPATHISPVSVSLSLWDYVDATENLLLRLSHVQTHGF